MATWHLVVLGGLTFTLVGVIVRRLYYSPTMGAGDTGAEPVPQNGRGTTDKDLERRAHRDSHRA